MSRLSTIPPSSASGIASELYISIKKAAGIVPNVYATIGTHSPTGLKAILELDKIIEESSLSKNEIEAIRLKVSLTAECNYSVAAHMFLGKFAGLSPTDILNIKTLQPTKIAKLDILLDFVFILISSKGVVSLSSLQSLFNAGYTEKNLIEICLVITSTTFINLVNKINNTSIDFPQFNPECAEKKKKS